MGDKKRRSAEELASKNRHVVEPSGLMVASRSAAREEESRQRRQREAIDSSEQWESSTASDADLASTIGQLPSHLQPMATLLAKMVSPSIEGRIMEKRGNDALE